MASNMPGSVLALVGAVAAIWSSFRAWYDGLHGSAIRIEDLFMGISTQRPDTLFLSVFLPMLVAGVLAVVGVALKSRTVVAVAGVVALGFTVLWMVQQGQALGSLTAGGTQGLGSGAALAAGGGLLMLLGALLMPGRRVVTSRHRRGRRRVEPEADARARPGGTARPGLAERFGPATERADPTHGLPPAPPPDEPWSPGHRHTS